MDITYDPPTSEADRAVVMNEVYRYWRRWMIRSGAGQGVSEACSDQWQAPHEGESGYSDYEEHRFLMEATPLEIVSLYAMFMARGIKPSTLGNAS
jgi:hypothetical protein